MLGEESCTTKLQSISAGSHLCLCSITSCLEYLSVGWVTSPWRESKAFAWFVPPWLLSDQKLPTRRLLWKEGWRS